MSRWIWKRPKAIALALVLLLLLPILFFLGVVAITGIQCCRTAAENRSSEIASRKPSQNEIALAASPERIELYSVPLQCPLVKRLGCGSEAKPIMKRLESDPAVAGAWLSYAGTALAFYRKGRRK